MALFIGIIGSAQMAMAAWLAVLAPQSGQIAATLWGTGTVSLGLAGVIVALGKR